MDAAAASRTRHGNVVRPRTVTSDDEPDVDTAGVQSDCRRRRVAGGLRRRAPRRPRSPGATRAWSEWADWAVAQIDDRLGAATLQHLDEAEFQAWEHTIRVLDRLRHLDAVGGPATRSEFRSVFAAEFDVAPAGSGGSAPA